MKSSNSKYHQCLYFSTSALARKIEKLAFESWKNVNLSPSHGYLLLLVIENPAIKPKQLSDQLLLQPSTITRLIEKLEEKELVTRKMEGKNTWVYATDKAKNLYPQLLRCIENFKNTCTQYLGEKQCNCMVSEIHKMVDVL